MIDRRTFFKGVTSVALASAGGMRAAFAASTGDADSALKALLQRHAESYLVRCPEDATRFGYDQGANAGLRSRLDDRSLEAIARDRGAMTQALSELSRIDRAALSNAAKLDHDVAAFVYTTLKDLLTRCPYGYVDLDLRPSPYVVSQMNGTYYWLPDFLGTSHPLESAADVDAYLARLWALATALDQETERMRHDAGLGVVPPDFVLARTIAQIQALRDAPAAQTALLGPAIERAAKAELGDIRERAERVFRKTVAPALSRQIAALQGLTSRAVGTAGVWRLQDGEAYYAAAVHSNTTSSMAIADLHELGLKQVADITARLDSSLKAQGYSKGTVGERIAALSSDTRFLVPNTDAGRARLLAEARRLLAAVQARLPAAFKTVPDAPIEVRRTPLAIENGAPGAFYSEGVGGRPGVYSLNLKTPAELPLWRLPTLTFHEGIPGHHFQYSVLKSAGELPLYRRLPRFSAYTEGWALYAERVAAELGLYEQDPIGRMGLMQSELFRAARIVVDTGLHYKRWTRAEANRWMIDNAGARPGESAREIDRYCVYPGQACSFMVGANQIRAAREGARKRMGSRFDVRSFHDLVLRCGPMPLDVLESAVAQWIGG